MNYNNSMRGRFGFDTKRIHLLAVMVLMVVVLQNFQRNVQGKAISHVQKTTLKFLQRPSSLIQLRHKRDNFANKQQHQQKRDGSTDDYYYDDNYDVLPGVSASSPPPTLEDQISEKAKQVAQSFTNMWQSLTDSVQHCFNALRAMFGDAVDDDVGEAELTPEQQQELLKNMEEQYRMKQDYDNEVYSNVF